MFQEYSLIILLLVLLLHIWIVIIYLMHLPHVSIFYLLCIYFIYLHDNDSCFIHCFNMEIESEINFHTYKQNYTIMFVVCLQSVFCK